MPTTPILVRRRGVLALAGVAAAGLAGCSPSRSAAGATAEQATPATPAGTGIWDASALHTIAVTADASALTGLVDTYRSTGEKDWAEVTVAIDGTTFERAGLRLKGNSSLRSVSADADPSTLPWLVRLDTFVDGQDLDGWTGFVVRSNSTTTSLNEAVALDLLGKAGLATEAAVATSFSVNGSGPALRLVLQELDDRWQEATFGTPGLLYKAESGGDWSYRGDDPESYTDVFDQEAGVDDLTPLIDFLQFVNESTDDELVAGLPDRLDVDSFARYLAFQELVDNFDDIDGPGNNAYLHYATASKGFTVVAWDHNLAFGSRPGAGGAGGGGGRPGGGARPSGVSQGDPPQGGAPLGDAAGGGRGGPGGNRSNVLVQRFTAVPEWAALKTAATADLTAELYTSGVGADLLDRRVAVLTDDAADLVDAATVEQEAAAIRTYLT